MMMIREPDSWRLLTTVDEVVDAVGGTMAAARLARRRAQQISLARKTGMLPHGTFLNFAVALAARQLRAPAALWRIDEPFPIEP
jgi:hypothetical protein